MNHFWFIKYNRHSLHSCCDGTPDLCWSHLSRFPKKPYLLYWLRITKQKQNSSPGTILPKKSGAAGSFLFNKSWPSPTTACHNRVRCLGTCNYRMGGSPGIFFAMATSPTSIIVEMTHYCKYRKFLSQLRDIINIWCHRSYWSDRPGLWFVVDLYSRKWVIKIWTVPSKGALSPPSESSVRWISDSVIPSFQNSQLAVDKYHIP